MSGLNLVHSNSLTFTELQKTGVKNDVLKLTTTRLVPDGSALIYGII